MRCGACDDIGRRSTLTSSSQAPLPTHAHTTHTSATLGPLGPLLNPLLCTPRRWKKSVLSIDTFIQPDDGQLSFYAALIPLPPLL